VQDDGTLDHYYSVVIKSQDGFAEKSLKWECDFLFGDTDLSGSGFLDIGGGIGLGSFYAACAGATEVVCLEPEADGSSHGMRDDFARLSEALGVSNVHLVNSTFQEYKSEPERFGTVFLNASVNHLDEPACMDILKSEEARKTYIGLFRRMAELTTDNGAIIISDVSRHNVFPALGLTNPVMRTIEWHKHQSPLTWAKLLREAGYGDIKITWHTPRPFGSVGRVLFGNSVVAFLTRSRFRVLARKLSKTPQ
jgi:hypothetical protein